jgi:phosphonate transport system substrate-binding protein
MRLHSLRAVVALALVFAAPWAQALVLAVNESGKFKETVEEVRARYTPIAADLSKLLGQPVQIEPVDDIRTLRQGLTASSYDVAFVHPAHLSIVAQKKNGWQLVAVSKGYADYTVSFLVRGDSTLQSLADLAERKIGAPEESSLISRIARATLRDALGGLDKVSFVNTRYQDAVPFMVQNALAEAGVTASNSIVKDWQAKGGRVLASSKPVPIKHVIASPNITPEQMTALRGRKKLKPINIKGYVAYDQAALLELGAWLGL